jgi:hypothetical protein
MKRILLAFGLLFITLIGFNSCAVEGTAYSDPYYYQPQVRSSVYIGTPPPRYYHRHYYHRHYYSPRYQAPFRRHYYH